MPNNLHTELWRTSGKGLQKKLKLMRESFHLCGVEAHVVDCRFG